MIWFLSILAFLVIFSILILVHEFGHFWVARKCGVKVEEFGFGLPPRLWKFKPKNSETVYTLNAIPFGGFVRLYGEDSHDLKALQNKQSFASKPVWMKLLVIVAGVTMNFLLAFVLLCVGLGVGMQPLIGSSEEAFQAIQDGTIKLQEGIIVKGDGINKIGFQAGDKVLAVNGQKILLGDEIAKLKDQQLVNFQIERNGQMLTLKGVNDLKKPFAQFYDSMVLPKIVVVQAEAGNAYGLSAGQEITAINGQRVFSQEDLEKQLSDTAKPQIDSSLSAEDISVAKNADVAVVAGLESFPVIVSAVLPDSNAEKAGLQAGDRIEEVNQLPIKSVDNLATALKIPELDGKVIYKINRAGTETEYYIHKGEDGLIGVVLSLVEKSDKLKMSFYTKSVPFSVMKIENISYPLLEVPGRALQEMAKLSVLTAKMFVNVFASILTKFSVPEGVAGPVGIAQMTFVFVQEGMMSLVRFTALLSLSLAIINILPFPGLDGGRFFLIVVPFILRKKLNPRLEAMIHLFGFVILMLLILMVTFNDLARLFS